MKSIRAMLVAAALFAGAVQAHEFKAGDLRIGHPHARATVAAQPTGAAYLSIQNKGKAADRLIAASTPVAQSVEIHSMKMDGNVMRMREVAAIEVPAGGKVSLAPGADYHLMLVGLKQPLKLDDAFPLTLTFEKAGKVEVSVTVDGAAAGGHQH
ncbi:copper chaperone PCu(A)C [Oxalobacteraceae bacterium OM1]|nr:copper chaperone PCu(A)C [Oxalobacteraceae bacterium OM1]